MTVQELIFELQKLNQGVDVVLDVDDNFTGNYLEVTEVFPSQSNLGVTFVVLKH